MIENVEMGWGPPRLKIFGNNPGIIGKAAKARGEVGTAGID
jgi:hypothetical protein